MAGVKTKFTGVSSMHGALRGHLDDIRHACAVELNRESEALMTEARILTPVDTGVLRASGHVQGPFFPTRLRITTFVGFGGPAGAGGNTEDVGYAVRVHEDIELFGSSPGGGTRGTTNGGRARRIYVGQAKYLETPARRRRRDFTRRYAARVRARLARG